MLRGKSNQTVAHKQKLRVHGLLDPGRTVLIEGSDSVLWRHELGVRLVGRGFAKVDDGLLRRPVVP
jgi:hypothetical protein